jgi:hypothetical protein
MSLVLVVIYGLRPFVKQPPGHSHPLLGPQKAIGWLTVLAGWTAMFLGCAVVHYSWVSGTADDEIELEAIVRLATKLVDLLLTEFATFGG